MVGTVLANGYYEHSEEVDIRVPVAKVDDYKHGVLGTYHIGIAPVFYW